MPNLFDDIRKLEQYFGLTPGTLNMPNSATLGVIRSKMKTMIGDLPTATRCVEVERAYKMMFQRANNAVLGGGQPSTFMRVWTNFISATVAYVECILGRT